MTDFGWSYPPGCTGTPYDNEKDEPYIDPEKLRERIEECSCAGQENLSYRVPYNLEAEDAQEIAPGLGFETHNIDEEEGYTIVLINIKEAKDWLAAYDKDAKERSDAEVALIEQEIAEDQ